ncbi:asparagine--tRNA ligase [Candidatus Woesearchaeota archaeon]|nr:asparagine--tRNA ligase [Candidatus Woesearchaeota archaeon]
MTDFKTIQQAIDKGSGKVHLRGWIYRERNSNKFRFIVLRDATNIIQCVIKKEEVDERLWDLSVSLGIETSVEVTGTIKEDKRAPTGYEVDVSDFKVIGESHSFPIQKDQSAEFLLDQRHLWVRSRYMTSILKVRHTVFQAFREFFNKKGFFESHMPMFTPTSCEGGSTVFAVKYFNDKVYLTQSWQLYAEAVVFGLEKIYTIAPCFRAEKSKTSRHLSEFWMGEMEAAWMDLEAVTKNAEQLIEYIVQSVLKNNRQELEILKRDVKPLQKIKAPFHHLTYDEVLEVLNSKDKLNITWGKDLRTVEEDALMKHFDKPVIVMRYPKNTMAFYKPIDPENPKVALCFDMLAPEGYGEIVGGSQRDTDIHGLIKSLNKEGELLKNYQWYLDLRRFGSVPHSGYGVGMERIVSWVCGLDNIKDSIPFPRTMLRKSP